MNLPRIVLIILLVFRFLKVYHILTLIQTVVARYELNNEPKRGKIEERSSVEWMFGHRVWPYKTYTCVSQAMTPIYGVQLTFT